MSVIPVLADQPFGPERIEILASAFDDVWETIKRSGSKFASPGYAGGARDIVHIIELAKQRILDRNHLSADAGAVVDPRRKAALFWWD